MNQPAQIIFTLTMTPFLQHIRSLPGTDGSDSSHKDSLIASCDAMKNCHPPATDKSHWDDVFEQISC